MIEQIFHKLLLGKDGINIISTYASHVGGSRETAKVNK